MRHPPQGTEGDNGAEEAGAEQGHPAPGPAPRDVCHLAVFQDIYSSRMFWKEALGAAQAGFRVGVAAPQDCWAPPDSGGVRTYPLPRQAGKLRLRATWAALRLALAADAPVLHVHDLQTLLVGVVAKRWRGAAVVYDAHEDYPFVHAKNLRILGRGLGRLTPWAEGVMAWGERRLCRRVDGVLAVDELIAAKFRRWGCTAHAVRNLAWRHTSFPPVASPEQLAGWRRKLAGRKVFAYLGEVHRHVAAVELVRAMALVREAHPEAYLLFIGGCSEPDFQAQLQRETKRLRQEDGVGFLAEVPYWEVFAYLALVDVGLVTYAPSDNYGDRSMFTHKVCDYLGAGLPLLASDFQGLREVVEGLGLGVCADPADPADLARAMRRFLEEPEQAVVMAGNARRAFEQELNWEREQAPLLALYARLLSRGMGNPREAAAGEQVPPVEAAGRGGEATDAAGAHLHWEEGGAVPGRREGRQGGPLVAYAVGEANRRAAAELFQLLKLPAVEYQAGVHCDCLLSDGTVPAEGGYRVLLLFTPQETPLDAAAGTKLRGLPEERAVFDGMARIPVRCGIASIDAPGTPLLRTKGGDPVAIRLPQRKGLQVVRFGFDLFAEVARLLREGQPEDDAANPTLDRHLALLRRELGRHTLLVEVPPVPWGHPLTITLSHDVDHLSLAEHGFGERWLAFLKHSLLLSSVAWLARRMRLRDLLAAWRLAVVSPLIIARWLPDPWSRLEDYVTLERAAGFRSTFYFISFRGRNGIDLRGQANHRRRRADYDLAAHRPLLQRLLETGNELGLHGLDAWHSTKEAIAERQRLEEAAGSAPSGVRMHFLYQDADSFRRLDHAGFRYDSTFGYPRRTGFRAGTLQPYRPLEAANLLEFPVHLEDGALLARDGEYRRPPEAAARIGRFLELAEEFGGALNVSWHSHNLGPPNSWGRVYRQLLREAGRREAWVVPLADACRWFAARRAVRLAVLEHDDREVRVRVELPQGWPTDLPPARLRVHLPGETGKYMDLPLRSGTARFRLQEDQCVAEAL